MTNKQNLQEKATAIAHHMELMKTNLRSCCAAADASLPKQANCIAEQMETMVATVAQPIFVTVGGCRR